MTYRGPKIHRKSLINRFKPQGATYIIKYVYIVASLSKTLEKHSNDKGFLITFIVCIQHQSLFTLSLSYFQSMGVAVGKAMHMIAHTTAEFEVSFPL